MSTALIVPAIQGTVVPHFKIFFSLRFQSETTNQGPPGTLDTITLCDCVPVPSVIHPEAMMDTVQETVARKSSTLLP